MRMFNLKIQFFNNLILIIYKTFKSFKIISKLSLANQMKLIKKIKNNLRRFNLIRNKAVNYKKMPKEIQYLVINKN